MEGIGFLLFFILFDEKSVYLNIVLNMIFSKLRLLEII
jgi:hypothetical protein